MPTDPAFAEAIRAKFDKSAQRVKRAESAWLKAKHEHEELAVTWKTLIRHGLIDDIDAPAQTRETDADMNDDQSVVLGFVPKGQPFALSPKEVVTELHDSGRDDLSADYVRTTLWRFAKRGVLKSESGLYWWPSAASRAEDVAAPDAKTSGADNGSVGPHGGGSGFPSTSPEGSIPSGSTQVRRHPAWDVPDDDDVPF